MSLVKRNEVFLPSIWNEIFSPDWSGGREGFEAKIPPVNILESKSDFEIELAVPGFDKKDFSIDIDKNILTVSVKKEIEKEDENEVGEGRYSRKEFKKHAFSRAFNLPKSIAEEEVSASYKNGVLKFVLPKKEEALARAKREISLT